LTDAQRQKIEEKGRFRDADTREIFRDLNKPLSAVGTRNKCLLCFEADRMPKANEIIIRYRLKTKTVRPRECAEEELYIDKNEETAMLKTMMASKFDIDNTSMYELKRARNDWGMKGAAFHVDGADKFVKQLKLDDTQKLLLIETVDPSKRYLDVYCEVEEVDGVKQFKIPKRMLVDGDREADEKKQESVDDAEQNSSYIGALANGVSGLIKHVIGSADNNDETTNNSHSNMDVDDEKDEKNEKESSSQDATPNHDGMDIYDANSELLCTLYLDKQCTGSDVKKAIRECGEYGLDTKLDPKIEPLFYRVSIKKKTKKKVKWYIVTPTTKFPQKTQKCIVEFYDQPKRDNNFGNPNGRCLVFVYKYVHGHNNAQHAVYGSRFEIELLVKQRRSLAALKNKILESCNWKDSINPDNMVLAIRDIASHKWALLSDKLQAKRTANNKQRSAKKPPPKERVIEQRIMDRDVIAVLDTTNMDGTMKQHINAAMFETEWDKYCFQKYQEKQAENDDDDDDDEPELVINFRNDSQDEDEEEEANGNNNNNNANDDD